MAKLFLFKPVVCVAAAAMFLAAVPRASAQKQPSQSNQPNQPNQNNQPSQSNQPNQPKQTRQQKQPRQTDSEYINSILPQARRIQKQYGIPLDLTLAIARQESGNGDYVIGKGNHFGLRCDSDDCITLEKNGQMISYETCPRVAECFNIFAESVNALTGDKSPTTQLLYQNGYATSPTWKERVDTIRQEVQQTLSEAGIKY